MLKIMTENCDADFVPDILNLGCGTDYKEYAINIDRHINDSNVMLVPSNAIIMEGEITSPQDLPKKHFKRIEAQMMLEHVHPALVPNLLYCLSNFLQDNGALIATVPNFIYLSYRIMELYSVKVWKRKHIEEMQEINNEFLCPNMGNIGNHQSIWMKQTAKIWLNAEGLSLVDWVVSKNLMHVSFKAVKLGGDHCSPLGKNYE